MENISDQISRHGLELRTDVLDAGFFFLIRNFSGAIFNMLSFKNFFEANFKERNKLMIKKEVMLDDDTKGML